MTRYFRLLAPACAGVFSFLASASAEPQRRVALGEITFALTITNGGVEITYIDPPVMLRELGVTTGSPLVRGRWQDVVLQGEAYAFAAGCPPIGYPVRGVVEHGGALVIIGPVPSEIKDCTVTALEWNSEAVMRFTPVDGTKRMRAKSKREPAAKPKPKSKPKPRPQYQQPAQPQSPWQWRW